jgi:DNA-binding MarR family transcriptional regulator
MADVGTARLSLAELQVNDGDGAALADIAHSLYRSRRRRDGLFAAGLFGEPAWDILLDLFAADADGEEVTVSSACAAAAAPKTTALRYIGRLERIGLVERRPVPGDRRRALLSLSRAGRVRVGSILADLRRACEASARVVPAVPVPRRAAGRR